MPGAALHLKSGALERPPVLSVKANLRPQAGGAAMIGAGPVARQSLAALSEVVKLEQVRVWSRDHGRSEEISFGTAMATAVGSVQQAVAGAGLVLTATPAREPLIAAADLGDHAVVLALGADTRGKRELGDGVLDDAELVADVPAAEVGQVGTLLDFAG